MGCHSIQFASAGDIKNCDVTKNRKIYRYLTLSTDYILPLVSRTLSIYLFIEPKDKAYLLLRIGIFLQFRTNDSLFRSPIHPFRYFTGEFATEISYLLAVDCTTIKPLLVVTVRNLASLWETGFSWSQTHQLEGKLPKCFHLTNPQFHAWLGP